MRRLVTSFNSAIEGFLFVMKSQRNMRIHFMLAFLVIFFGVYLNFSRVELMLLCITISLVLLSEMVNTAMEIVLDYVQASHSHWVRVVKDISAGGVLIASLNALVVGYFLFFREVIFSEFSRGLYLVRQSDWHISFLSLVTVLAIVIASKVVFHKGEPLRGGMPSGHSAIAFAAWMLIILISQNPLIIFISLILALLIAQSRVARRFHTPWEAIAGALVGILTTLTIYLFLKG